MRSKNFSRQILLREVSKYNFETSLRRTCVEKKLSAYLSFFNNATFQMHVTRGSLLVEKNDNCCKLLHIARLPPPL